MKKGKPFIEFIASVKSFINQFEMSRVGKGESHPQTSHPDVQRDV